MHRRVWAYERILLVIVLTHSNEGSDTEGWRTLMHSICDRFIKRHEC
jgi:hypothetical protein